jgi:hypothetical protein
LSIHKTFDVNVRVEPTGQIALVFASVRGSCELERDANGAPVAFAFPLGPDDAKVARLVHLFARWIADLAAQEMQAEQAAVHQATARPEALPDQPRRRRRRNE